MTARPQPMAGQPEASDDLIAELARLMAQDARPSEPAPEARPTFAVRIPGGDSAPVSPKPVKAEVQSSAPAPAKQAPVPAPAAEVEPEPFRFDFDLTPRQSVVPAAASHLDVAQPKPTIPASRPAPAPVASAAPAPVFDHDAIADLIAAELAVANDPRPAPQPKPAPVSITPQTPPAETARPVPVPPPSPQAPAEPAAAAPRTGNGHWSPVGVPTHVAGQEQHARPVLKAVNLQPAPRAEQDSFKVPPVFGLGSASSPAVNQPAPPTVAQAPRPAEPVVFAPAPKPEAAPAQGTTDPIDEIESLIGRAMRVELGTAEPVPPVSEPAPAAHARPALQALAETAERAAPPQADRALSGADEAILEAARATGAQVGWVDAGEESVVADDPVTRAPRTSRVMGLTRAVAGPLVAVTLLLAAGFGLYWVLGLGRDSGPAPLLTADAEPVKEVPVVEPDAAAAQQSVVFNEIDGVVPGAEEQLVSRDQADVEEVTQVAAAIPDVSEEGLANRKVRTVTVRPDGTIVSGDEGVAGSSILPIDRPNVPAVPGAETASPELVAKVQADLPAGAEAAPEVTPVAPEPAATLVEPGSTVAVVDAAGNPVPGKTAPVPVLKPAGLPQVAEATNPTVTPTSPVNAVIDTSAVAPAPLAAAPAVDPISLATEVAAVGNNAPAYAQLASLRTEAEARQAASALITRFGPLFGGANMEVQRVDLGARGIYYRVRVPADSMQQARNICTNVTAAGGECVAM